MLAISERVWHLTRMISVREGEGYGRHMDYPPARFMNEPVPDGPNEGHCITKPEAEQLLDDYYAARGWDENGIPTLGKLKAVGLAESTLPLKSVTKILPRRSLKSADLQIPLRLLIPFAGFTSICPKGYSYDYYSS